MAKGNLVRALRAFNYNGDDLVIGQVVKLAGLRNDERLFVHGRIEPFDGETVDCGECSARFDSEQARFMHGQKQHS